MLQLDDRICVARNFGTIKYIGLIHVWPNVEAYGVEWDDPSQGKNDGSVDGIRYFKCPKGAGSFIKASNSKINKTMLFSEAIERRYGAIENEEALRQSLTIDTKTIEQLGFSKLNFILKDYCNLAVIMLDRQCILRVGTVPPLSKLEHLDLSYNLLTLWVDIGSILAQSPNLKSLNLNGNRFCAGILDSFPPGLTHLSLCDSQVMPNNLPPFENSNLERLELAGNGWSDQDIETWSVPLGLSTLDVSLNLLTSVPTLISLSNIRALIIHSNRIKNLNANQFFPNLASLDMRHNLFESLSLLDPISVVFPNLSELRIIHCPALKELLVDEITMALIGRLNCTAPGVDKVGISKLNGSFLLEEEVSEGELYFISQVRKGVASLDNPDRLSYLYLKYSILKNVEMCQESDKTIVLQIYQSDPVTLLMQRRYMKSNSVLRLKGTVSRRLQKSILDFELYYFSQTDSTKRCLDDNLATILSFALTQNQKLFIEEV